MTDEVFMEFITLMAMEAVTESEIKCERCKDMLEILDNMNNITGAKGKDTMILCEHVKMGPGKTQFICSLRPKPHSK